jgi:hypothetical protein
MTAGALSANTLITPTGLTTNGIAEFFPAENMINNSGLSADPEITTYESVTHLAASATTAWTTDNPNGAGDYFLEGSEGQVPEFTFTLPELSTVSALVYWGYFFSGTNGNETREFVVAFSRDGGTTFPETVTVGPELGDLAGESAKTLSFEQNFLADTIRLRLTDNHFGGGATEAGGDRMGLGEIKFIGSPGTGEPPAITGFEIVDDLLQITETTGLQPGSTYHLETGTTLQDFTPVLDSDFSSDSPILPSVPANGPVRFVRLVEGPINE